MAPGNKSLDQLIGSLEERVKEMNCMYEIEEILHRSGSQLDDIFRDAVKVIPAGFQYTDVCRVKIIYREQVFVTNDFRESAWFLSNDLIVQEQVVGWIKVYYTEERPEAGTGPFLREEVQLMADIAMRLGHHILYHKLKMVFNRWETTKQSISGQSSGGEWKVILDLLDRTDPDTYSRISRKMLNHLVWNGIEEAEYLLQQYNPYAKPEEVDLYGEANVPLRKRSARSSTEFNQKIFKIASKYLNDHQILSHIQKWMQQDKTSFLVKAISNNESSLTDISEAIRRYYQLNPAGIELAPAVRIGVRAALIRRFFTDQVEFINIAKNFVRVVDFRTILETTIFPTGSHGKLGGKSAGLFLANRILQESEKYSEMLTHVKIPKTWYITSDGLIHFMNYNNLEEITEQKYKNIDEVRKEYPHVVQLFKNSHFPPDLIQGISMALDDFGTQPLIVRSSSLLEDRLGSAFSGKYKSLFLANQGSKHERLEALMDAIAEVYASTIGPDPIEYRAERGLLDFHEEMGIMIQSVVGQQIGDYYFPAYAGVAFSNNEFRWSPRIRREDGLVRLVPGLGTRAVDRLSDDYPVLIAPGQPGLRANISISDVVHYSPHKIDVLNLKTNSFETLEIKDLFSRFGNDYPLVEKLVNIVEHQNLRKPMLFNTDFTREELAVNFDGLITDTPFVREISAILRALQNALASPVDIEFASDGKDFYLLQCRPQSFSRYAKPAKIPKEIPAEKLIFSANRFISNGHVPDIHYIVYVDPDEYGLLSDLEDLRSIGRIVGQMNNLLPRHQFILMGPGRWGSRGDIKLGVSVTYSDINNTAVLIEIARRKGSYVPDLSFGTHFFQDLVEAGIRYLPLYPDDTEIIFNNHFFRQCPNQLLDYLPGYSYLSSVVRVIEVPQSANGQILKILMNAEEERAVAILSPQGLDQDFYSEDGLQSAMGLVTDHSSWRIDMIERMVQQLDMKRFNIKAVYLYGSTMTRNAQAGSDIDILLHSDTGKSTRKELQVWLEAWSLALDEMNFLRTGFKAGGLLDIKFVSSREAQNQSYFLEMFNCSLESMRLLRKS